MANQLQLSQVKETIDRGKTYIEVFGEILNIKEMCKNKDMPMFCEYIPVKIVACFEQFFRDEYKEILYQSKTIQRLKHINIFKNAKFDFEVIGALEDNTITLAEYLSLLIPCSKLEDINIAISQLLNINFLNELKKIDEGKILASISELFKLRHIFCHEAPLGDLINLEKAMALIDDAKQFLEYSDDIIRSALYADNPTGIKEIEIAEHDFKDADAELVELIERIKLKTSNKILLYSNFDFIEKWKEYREERAKSESSMGKDSYLPLYYQRSMERTTRTLIKELKEDFKYELRR